MNNKSSFFSKLSIDTNKTVKKNNINTSDMYCFDYDYTIGTHTPIGKRFNLKFKPCTRDNGGWRDEIISTVKDVANTAKKEIYVLYSGGLDSEVVCMAMKKENIPFKAVSLVYTDISNMVDVNYAIKWCKENNVEHIIKEIKITDFVEEAIPFYQSLELRSRTIYRYLQCFYIDLIESMGGYGVICGGIDSLFRTESNCVGWKFAPDKLLVLDYCKKYNLDHCPVFYARNSELVKSYYQDRLFKFLTHNPCYVGNHFEIEKTMIHHSQWSNQDLKCRPKYGAVIVNEDLVDLNFQTTKKLQLLYPDILDIFYSVPEVLSQLAIKN